MPVGKPRLKPIHGHGCCEVPMMPRGWAVSRQYWERGTPLGTGWVAGGVLGRRGEAGERLPASNETDLGLNFSSESSDLCGLQSGPTAP